MAELKLNTTTSIVDFLKSQNKPSDFRSREKMFRESGLEDRLGTFVGSGAQNLALLRRLQGEQAKPEEVTPAPAAVAAEPAIAVPPELKDVIPEGTTAQDALKILGIPEIPTAADLVKQVEESPGFKLFREKQEATTLTEQAEAEVKKGKLEAEFVGNVATLENKLAASGLTFSGIKTDKIQTLTSSLAASQLGVDRALASKLLSQNIDLREQVLKTAEQVIKDAQADKKDAIQTLEKVGLTVVGNKIVPTFAARREEAVAERFERTAERLERTAGKKTAELINITGQLNSAIGADGFVNPDLYQRLRATAAISATDFDNRFKSMLSPENRKKLGIKASVSIVDDAIDRFLAGEEELEIEE